MKYCSSCEQVSLPLIGCIHEEPGKAPRIHPSRNTDSHPKAGLPEAYRGLEGKPKGGALKIEILWRSGAVECHTLTLPDGGIVVDARPAGDDMWAIKPKCSYGGFVKHDVAPMECATRREYAQLLARETIAVEVDGFDFVGALMRAEGVGAEGRR